MSAEGNKVVVHRFLEEMNRRNLNVYEDLFAPDFVGHPPPSMGPKTINLQGRVQVARAFLAAFPDLHHTANSIIEEGDKVAVTLTVSGTHHGEFRGMPPTGRRFEVPGVAVFRIEKGKVVEEWAVLDALGLLQQLGALAAPAPPKG